MNSPKYSVKSYCDGWQTSWNEFVLGAKNGHFFFQRDYIEYHRDRFPDASYLCFRNDRLIAVLPATKEQGVLYSHRGLTFGGLLSADSMTTNDMVEMLPRLCEQAKADGCLSIVYKPLPSFYHRRPAQEDLYVLHTLGAVLAERSVGSVLSPRSPAPVQERRRRSAKKAARVGVEVSEGDDVQAFWNLLEKVLMDRHGVEPVHSESEMRKLRKRFPGNIRVFCAHFEGEVVAGVVVFENPLVAHAQYIAASDKGRAVGALDLLFLWLIESVYSNKDWFSFGTSTEGDGTVLNAGLIAQKEGFGARAYVQDIYKLDI